MAEIRPIVTEDDWTAAVPVLQQLFTDADESEIRSWRDEDGYRLVGRFVDGDLVGVAGVSIQRVLHHERHLWVHDLVVDREHRSEGHGAALLEHVERWGRDRGCEHVSLACSLPREAAHRFYEEYGLTRWGYVFERAL